MAESNIEWTDFTFNPWRGCTKVSPACDSCYAETMSKRNPSVLGVWGKYGTRAIAAESYWKLPEQWNRKAEKEGVRRKVFCASLADVFEGEDTVPKDFWLRVQEARGCLWSLIAETPYLDWLLLTKRPENVRILAPFLWFDEGFPQNVWIGTTVENQKYADIRIPELLKIPAAVRFLSVEPMLGPVDLAQAHKTHQLLPNWPEPTRVDWVICGGESGSKARPMHPQWVRSLRDQCTAAGVPFFFKQWGEHLDIDTAIAHGLTNSYDGKYHPYSRISETSLPFVKVGKKAAGRILDGRTWDEFPGGVKANAAA